MRYEATPKRVSLEASESFDDGPGRGAERRAKHSRHIRREPN